MTDTPPEKAARVVAAQQRAGERMDGKIVLQTPQPPLTVAMPIDRCTMSVSPRAVKKYVGIRRMGSEFAMGKSHQLAS